MAMDPPKHPRCQVWQNHGELEVRCRNTGIRWVDHELRCDCGIPGCPPMYHLWECQGPCDFRGIAE